MVWGRRRMLFVGMCLVVLGAVVAIVGLVASLLFFERSFIVCGIVTMRLGCTLSISKFCCMFEIFSE